MDRFEAPAGPSRRHRDLAPSRRPSQGRAARPSSERPSPRPLVSRQSGPVQVMRRAPVESPPEPSANRHTRIRLSRAPPRRRAIRPPLRAVPWLLGPQLTSARTPLALRTSPADRSTVTRARRYVQDHIGTAACVASRTPSGTLVPLAAPSSPPSNASDRTPHTPRDLWARPLDRLVGHVVRPQPVGAEPDGKTEEDRTHDH